MDSLIADPGLAEQGERKIAWAEAWMPVMRRVRDRLRSDGTLAQIQDRWLNQAAHARTLQ